MALSSLSIIRLARAISISSTICSKRVFSLASISMPASLHLAIFVSIVVCFSTRIGAFSFRLTHPL
jgi:hypothetical protein